jgi:hypothetical protein
MWLNMNGMAFSISQYLGSHFLLFYVSVHRALQIKLILDSANQLYYIAVTRNKFPCEGFHNVRAHVLIDCDSAWLDIHLLWLQSYRCKAVNSTDIPHLTVRSKFFHRTSLNIHCIEKCFVLVRMVLGFDSGRGLGIFLLPPYPDRLWGPPSLISNG